MMIAAIMACLFDGIGGTTTNMGPVTYRLFEPPRRRRLQVPGKHLEPLS